MKATLLIIILIFSSDSIFSQQLENLGSNINTGNVEIVPVISPDGKILFFKKAKNDYQEQWCSETDYYGNWQPAVNIMDVFGSNFKNLTINSITPDGNKILVKKFAENDKLNSGLFLYYKTIDGWGNPEKLKIKNLDKYFDNACWANVILSNSGKVIIMSLSASKDCKIHNMSIYISLLLHDNTWSEPTKLGSPINVPNDNFGSFSPFIASDEKTLYFSSERKGGYGDCDIYYSKRLDDTWLKWSEPLNLGPEINSEKWDAYYSISAKGDYAYLVSQKNSIGGSDIFRIKLPEQVKPDPVVLVSGKVVNPANNQPLEAEIYYYTLPDNIEAGTARTNPATGVYKIILPYGKQYSFLAKVNGYYSISNYLDLTTISEYKEMNLNIDMKPIEVGETFRLNNIFFDFAQATLRSESFQELDRVYKLLTDNSTIEIELSGHTDNVGSDEINNTLSQSRADAVKDYLVKKGVNGSRIISKGYGKSNPVATNDTEEGKQLNRRVEFKILKK